LVFEWDDIRYFLAVARSGSTLAAAATTGSSQSTVTRRLAALESALSLKLFERLQSGSRLTDQGRGLLPLAERAEAAFLSLGEAAAVARRQLNGVIRFTLSPEGADPVMAEPLTAFMTANPGVKIELLLTDAFLDIAAGEADVALRSGPRPSEPDLVVRKVADILWGGFCSPGYLDRHGRPAGYHDLAGHQVIGAEGQLAATEAMQWLAGQVPRFVVHASSLRGLIGFARAGAGIAVMPALHGVADPGLVQCLPTLPDKSTPAWLVTRQDIRRTPHVRAFLDFLTAHLGQLARGFQAGGLMRTP
jgi:DNA-binding transcriptional LysR family regulator